jgi:hypothetical protein
MGHETLQPSRLPEKERDATQKGISALNKHFERTRRIKVVNPYLCTPKNV